MISIDVWLVVVIALSALILGMIVGSMLLRSGSAGGHRY